MGISDIMKPGFYVTTVENVFNWARAGSLWPMSFGLACCARGENRAQITQNPSVEST